MISPLQGQCIKTLGKGLGAAVKAVKIWCETSLLRAAQTQLLKAGILEYVINGLGRDRGKIAGAMPNEEVALQHERIHWDRLLEEMNNKDKDARILGMTDDLFDKAEMRLLPARTLNDVDRSLSPTW